MVWCGRLIENLIAQHACNASALNHFFVKTIFSLGESPRPFLMNVIFSIAMRLGLYLVCLCIVIVWAVWRRFSHPLEIFNRVVMFIRVVVTMFSRVLRHDVPALTFQGKILVTDVGILLWGDYLVTTTVDFELGRILLETRY